MRSNVGMANRQGDVELRFAQVSAPQLELWLGRSGPGACRPAGHLVTLLAADRTPLHIQPRI